MVTHRAHNPKIVGSIPTAARLVCDSVSFAIIEKGYQWYPFSFNPNLKHYITVYVHDKLVVFPD